VPPHVVILPVEVLRASLGKNLRILQKPHTMKRIKKQILVSLSPDTKQKGRRKTTKKNTHILHKRISYESEDGSGIEITFFLF